MDVELNPHEARVLGVLIEKAFATPDQYPLSLNGATTGSNQKSNRNPLVSFSEAEVTVAFQGLQMKHLAGPTFPAGSRVEKWHHNAKEHLRLSDDRDVAILAELLLRGPQTPGELRTRASRMRMIASLEELNQALARLVDKGYATHLPPAAGSRAERYGQLLAPTLYLEGEGPAPAPASAPVPAPPLGSSAVTPAPSSPAVSGIGVRVERLEGEVVRLRRQLEKLAEKLGEPLEG